MSWQRVHFNIVALRTDLISQKFNTDFTPGYVVSWDDIFDDVQDALENTSEYEGKTERGDKCITVNTNYKADVVPAVVIGSADSDPIAIHSFKKANERKNYPRIHYANNVQKQSQTSGNYKPTVRMFKRWARNWFEGKNIAPSFYVECLVHRVPANCFTSDRALTFYLVGTYIIQNIVPLSVLKTVAGDKNVLTSGEWHPAKFRQFRVELRGAVRRASLALKATSVDEAQYYWKKAFNEWYKHK